MTLSMQQAESNYETKEKQSITKIEQVIDNYLSSYFKGQKRIALPIQGMPTNDRNTLEKIIDNYLKAGWKNVRISLDSTGTYAWMELEYDSDKQKGNARDDADAPYFQVIKDGTGHSKKGQQDVAKDYKTSCTPGL